MNKINNENNNFIKKTKPEEPKFFFNYPISSTNESGRKIREERYKDENLTY